MFLKKVSLTVLSSLLLLAGASIPVKAQVYVNGEYIQGEDLMILEYLAGGSIPAGVVTGLTTIPVRGAMQEITRCKVTLVLAVIITMAAMAMILAAMIPTTALVALGAMAPMSPMVTAPIFHREISRFLPAKDKGGDRQ